MTVMSSTNALDRRSNALDIARDAFTLLVTGPQPLAVDGRDFAGLPDRSVPLNELRDLLLSSCDWDTREAVWRYLVERARTAGPAWTVGCVGVALPALITVAARLSERFTQDRDDIAAAVLVGFVERLNSVDLGRPGVVVRLRWAAFRAGNAARRELLPQRVQRATGFRSQLPPLPWEHADLVLLCAIADEILTPAESELVGDTRLDRVRISAWARARNLNHAAVYKARARAEHRLHSYLTDRCIDVGPEYGFTVAGAFPLYYPPVPMPAGMSESGELQLAVSGRLRNGRAVKSTNPVSKNSENPGLHRRGSFAPAAKSLTISDRNREGDRRCQ